MKPHQIEQPNVVEPPAVLVDASGQDGDALLVDHVEGVVLPRARLLLVCGDLLPTLEFQIQVLGHLS